MNRLSWALILISSIAVSWFSFFFVKDVYGYVRVNQRTSATISEWSIKENSESEYLLCALYNYDYKGVKYSSSTVFRQPLFLNRPTAERAIVTLRTKPWTAWFDPSNPERSTLQRYFPFQEGIKLFLCIIVAIYFVVLRFTSRRNTV